MGDKLRQDITLPAWALGGMLTILLSMFYVMYLYGTDTATLKLQAKVNAENIEKKMDKETFNAFLQSWKEMREDVKDIKRGMEQHLNR